MARPAAHSTWGQRARGDECTYSTPRAVVVTMLHPPFGVRCVFPYDLSNGDFPVPPDMRLSRPLTGYLGKYAGRLAGITRSETSARPLNCPTPACLRATRRA